MTQLTAHFALEEFTRSDTAERLGIDNTPDADEQKAILNLCQNLLEPLRFVLMTAFDIDSGFRCEKLNDAVGGVKDSQHRLGEACDGKVKGLEPEQVIHRLLEANIEFDEAIAEHDFTTGEHWTHLSFTTRRPNRRLVTRAIRENGRTAYYPWDKR